MCPLARSTASRCRSSPRRCSPPRMCRYRRRRPEQIRRARRKALHGVRQARRGADDLRRIDRDPAVGQARRRSGDREARPRSSTTSREIEVKAEQHGNRIEVGSSEPKREHGFNLHFGNRSAKLIVSMPASSDVRRRAATARSTSSGSPAASSCDRAMAASAARCSAATSTRTPATDHQARWQADGLQVHTGDGSVTIHADSGSAPAGDWEHHHRRRFGDAGVAGRLRRRARRAHRRRQHPHARRDALERHRPIGKSTVRGRLGNGGHAVKVRTGDGSITLRRKLKSDNRNLFDDAAGGEEAAIAQYSCRRRVDSRPLRQMATVSIDSGRSSASSGSLKRTERYRIAVS